MGDILTPQRFLRGHIAWQGVCNAMSAILWLFLSSHLTFAFESEEPSAFFPTRLVWQGSEDKSVSESESPRQYSLFFYTHVDVGLPQSLAIRGSIQRNEDEHSVLLQTEEGFPISYSKGNCRVYLPSLSSNNIAVALGQISDVSTTYSFETTETNSWRFTASSNPPSIKSSIGFHASQLTDFVKTACSLHVSDAKEKTLCCRSNDGRRFAVLQKTQNVSDLKTSYLRVSFGKESERYHLLPQGKSVDPALSHLSWDINLAKEARRPMIGEWRLGKSPKEKTTQLLYYWESTTANFQKLSNPEGSDEFHRYLPRSRKAEEAMHLIGDVYPLLSVLHSSESPSAKRAEVLRRLYNDKLVEILDKFIETDDVTAVPDPLLRSWYAETLFGPLVTSRLRATLFEIAEKREEPIETRRMAFASICSIGWTHRYDSRILALRKDFRVTKENDSGESDAQLPTNHIQWMLVEGRAGLLTLPVEKQPK